MNELHEASNQIQIQIFAKFLARKSQSVSLSSMSSHAGNSKIGPLYK